MRWNKMGRTFFTLCFFVLFMSILITLTNIIFVVVAPIAAFGAWWVVYNYKS